MKKGNRGDKLFIVAEGSVEVFQKLDFHINRTIRELKKSEHFGKLALLSSENIFSASVRAIEQPTNFLNFLVYYRKTFIIIPKH